MEIAPANQDVPPKLKRFVRVQQESCIDAPLTTPALLIGDDERFERTMALSRIATSSTKAAPDVGVN